LSGQTSDGKERILVRTIVCGFTQAELPTPWLAIFHRFERVMEKAGLRIRVRLFPLEKLPDSFEVLVVPPELEAAIRESRASEDIAIRRKAFATVQRLVMENAFVAPLAFQFELVAMNKKVQGYRPNLLGKPKYDDVWLES